MMIWNAWLPVKPRLSVTVIVKLKVPVALGVPEMTRLEELSVVPLGSAPDVTANVNGDVPPCAAIVGNGRRTTS